MAIPGYLADGYSFVQARRSLTAAAVQKLRARCGCLRAEPRGERGDDTAAATTGPDVEPGRLGPEHAPEHVVNERPLGHADDLTVALCEQQVPNWTLAEVCGTQCLRRSRMILGWMTRDEIGEFRMTEHPERIAMSFTLGAVKPS